jgi:CHAD domain-containing protein
MATLNQNNADYTVRLNRESKHNRGLLRANSQVRIANRLGDVLGTNAKRLARLRRRAGKVRDIDVLTDFASTVRPKEENECSVMLLEHLGARRQKHAAKLRAAVRQEGSKLCKRLKGISTEFEKLLPEASANVAGLAVKLSTELASPAGLNKRNLHPYRLKVKELRNVLQMADNADQQEFIATLGEVKMPSASGTTGRSSPQ